MTDASEGGSEINRRLAENNMLRKIVDILRDDLPESYRDMFSHAIRVAYRSGHLTGWREAAGLSHKDGP